MSQSPAGSQLDSDDNSPITWDGWLYGLSQSPAGAQLDSDYKIVHRGVGQRVMSQSPAGSQLDSDVGTVICGDCKEKRCRNPPQGLSSIPTTCVSADALHGEECRNPPQGLSSIPTGGKERSLGPLKELSQSPAGAQLDSDSLMRPKVVVIRSRCRNPPQGLSSIPTSKRPSGPGSRSRTMSQSPAGSQLDSDKVCALVGTSTLEACRNPPQGLSSISTTPWGARAPTSCRNPPQGLSSIPTRF